MTWTYERMMNQQRQEWYYEFQVWSRTGSNCAEYDSNWLNVYLNMNSLETIHRIESQSKQWKLIE